MPPALCFLTEIPDAAWESLLPQLIKNKVAGAVALCCKLLRNQVQRGTKELCLSFGTNTAAAGLDTLPEHFPGCKKLRITVKQLEQIAVLSALPVLARWVAGLLEQCWAGQTQYGLLACTMLTSTALRTADACSASRCATRNCWHCSKCCL